MMVVPTSAQTSAPARTCGRDGNRRSTAGRHPAPTRARQRRHHQPLPTGHRQQRDHQHRPRTAFAGDLRDGRTASQALDDRSAERPVSGDRPGARSPGWRFARLAVGRGADLLSAARGAHDAGPIARRHPGCRAAWPAATSTRLQPQRGSSQRATARRCRWCPTREWAAASPALSLCQEERSPSVDGCRTAQPFRALLLANPAREALRAEQRDPRYRGRAAQLRGAKNAAHQAAVQDWVGERPDPAVFIAEILEASKGRSLRPRRTKAAFEGGDRARQRCSRSDHRRPFSDG
jgi:hypothetical protein